MREGGGQRSPWWCGVFTVSYFKSVATERRLGAGQRIENIALGNKEARWKEIFLRSRKREVWWFWEAIQPTSGNKKVES